MSEAPLHFSADPCGPLGEAHLALFAFFVPFDRRGRRFHRFLGDGFPNKNHAITGKMIEKSKNIRKMIGK